MDVALLKERSGTRAAHTPEMGKCAPEVNHVWPNSTKRGLTSTNLTAFGEVGSNWPAPTTNMY